MNANRYLLILLTVLPAMAPADPCRLESAGEAEVARQLVLPGTTVVQFCWYCDSAQPLPLRVRQVELRHTEPAQVEVITWAGKPAKHGFPLRDLEQAERDGTGPLAELIRADVEQQNSDTTGYLGPNDPYLVQQKRAQYAMQLELARRDHDMRSWDELYINGEPADPRLLYLPVGGDRYQSLGHQLGCLMDEAPHNVSFDPVERDPARAAPPTPYVADITGQCYDGACPRDIWRVIAPTPLLAEPRHNARRLGVLSPPEQATPLRTETHVTASRAIATQDHERFFADDVFYLLDSQAEGFHRVWHYGEVFVIDASGVDVRGRMDHCEQDRRCWARADAHPSETWWSKVRRSDGSEGWVRDPIRFLDGVLRSD